MQVTKRQYEYLKAIEGTAKATIEIATLVGTPRRTTRKMVNLLIDKGLVQRNGSSKSTTYTLKSNVDLTTLEIGRTHINGGQAITDDEKEFAVKLRKNGLVGQQLIDEYHKLYPSRSPAGIANVISVIRRGGCR